MTSRISLLAVVLTLCATGCVYVDTSLGQDFIPKEQQYEVHCAEFPLSEISLKKVTGLSAYSSRRIVVGSLRDETFGLTTRSSAFTLVPVNDSLDFGKNVRYRDYHISLNRDTVSVALENQTDILQNIGVYSMRDAGKKLDDKTVYIEDLKKSDFEGCPRISKGVPVFNGSDSLSFSFTREFGGNELNRMLEKADENGLWVIDTIPTFTDICPGIFLCCDDPVGVGGRLNFFDVSVQQSEGYVTGSYAELKFTADYGERKDVDTSFIFVFGATDFPEGTSIGNQYAFNVGDSEGKIAEGSQKAADILYVEGGCGVKPVFSAKEILDSMLCVFERDNISDISSIAVNKAELIIPYGKPEDFSVLDRYPTCLSPTCKIRGEKEDGTEYYTFANLTDANIEAEDHGQINRSLMRYSPDFAFHAQRLIRLEDPDEKTLSNYDIWCFIVATEYTVTEDESDSMSDYYNQLYYYNYLNSMYGGYGGYGGYGYGGYGYGYGGYDGYGYNNYYNMMYYSSLMNQSSSSTTSVSEELDRDRYYLARLTGPASTEQEKPRVRLTYSVPKSAEND